MKLCVEIERLLSIAAAHIPVPDSLPELSSTSLLHDTVEEILAIECTHTKGY